jgi:hypothetical protein
MEILGTMMMTMMCKIEYEMQIREWMGETKKRAWR